MATESEHAEQYDVYEFTYITCGQARIPKGAKLVGNKWGKAFYKYKGDLFSVEMTLNECDFKRADEEQVVGDEYGGYDDYNIWNEPELVEKEE